MSIPTSNIIAGTMNWGEWGKNFNTNEIQQLISTCLEEKICAFDHADIYGGYTTEAAFGKAWKQMNEDRESVHFITKCGIKYVCVPPLFFIIFFPRICRRRRFIFITLPR